MTFFSGSRAGRRLAAVALAGLVAAACTSTAQRYEDVPPELWPSTRAIERQQH